MKRKKVILITGGARGIGRAIAFQFAAEGFCVCINYKSSKKEAQKTVKVVTQNGGEAYSFQADVSRENEVKKLVHEVLSKVMRIDILVNNAGWSEYIPFSKIHRLTDKKVNRIIDANLKSVLYSSREMLPVLRRSRKGLIVNIASLSGIDAVGSNLLYCATKAAVLSLTKSFAHNCGSYVRVNAIAPNYVQTDFIKSIPKGILEKQRVKNSLFALLAPKDVAETVLSIYKKTPTLDGAVVILDGVNIIEKML